MNRELTNRLGHWLDCLFGCYSDKIKIIANVLVHDWRMSLPLYFDHSLVNVTDEEIKNFSVELDDQSLNIVSVFIAMQRIVSAQDRWYPGFCFYNYEKLFSREQKQQRIRMRKIFSELRKKYIFPCLGPESILFHHGLPFFPEAAIQYLAGGSFIDAGACYGDSTLIFSRFYKPARIYAFEPSKKNREVMKAMMTRFQVPEEIFEMIPFGLGEKREQLVFCEQEGKSSFGIRERGTGIMVDILPLDDYAKEHQLTNVRLVKADLEGMGLSMLKGAQQTIRKNRPILSLSIYHNRDELFEIYRTLRSWDLNYEFAIRSTAYPLAFSEITLLGYPAELNPGTVKWNPDKDVFNFLAESSKELMRTDKTAGA